MTFQAFTATTLAGREREREREREGLTSVNCSITHITKRFIFTHADLSIDCYLAVNETD